MFKSPRRDGLSTLPQNALKGYSIRARQADYDGEFPMSSDQALIRTTACSIIDQLNRGDVTPLDLLDVLERRIAAVDGKVNALPILCFDRARKQARTLMEKPVGGRGPLAGMPIPIKDLTNVAGVRTTQGSPIYRDFVPSSSDVLVEHLQDNGGVIYAKSNTPEFGAGANTFNEVFGATLNPWNLSRSAAGSSGGAAVALATGTAWLAHGTDMGGSLRNPASFCGVVGLRPSIGRVAHSPAFKIDRNLTVHGPMARNVEDLALLLDAMSGEDPADPLSLPVLPSSFRSAARSGKAPKRVAFSPDLGITPVDPEVAAITRKAALRFAEAGAIVEEAHPDLREAHECFHVLRAFDFAVSKAGLLRSARDRLKVEVIWNIEEGLKLSVEQLERAEAQRLAMTNRALEFFKSYDLLLTPATIVPPFPVEDRYVAECAGRKFDNYVQWLGIVYAITLACCPALSLPCGFTASGLPVGLQMVAPSRGEAQLLAGARVLEDILGLRETTPIDPRPAP
jgi:amidase